MDRGSILEATLFYLYILAAVTCTSLICQDLFQLAGRTSANGPRNADAAARRTRNTGIFMLQSVISFSILSYHMLNFLIASYLTWAQHSDVAVPETLYDLIPASRGTSLRTWTWSRATPLFQDFATVICDDPVRFWWTQQALVFSFAWNVYMTVEGRRRHVPRLWAYFVLDQILPVSLTMNLFGVALALIERPDPRMKWYVPDTTFQILPVMLYYLSVSLAPSAVGTVYFVTVVLTTRILLFTPFVLFAPVRQQGWLQSGTTFFENGIVAPYTAGLTALALGALGLYVRQTMAIEQVTLLQLGHAVQASPAVAALAYDYLLALWSVYQFWRLGVGKD